MAIIEVTNVSYRYKLERWILENVSLSIEHGERAAIVAPSGYGKSTLAKIIAGYLKPAKGEVLYEGKPLPDSGYSPIQLVYQHPEKAVNPRWKMRRVLSEAGMPEPEVLKALGIREKWLDRFPSELSGGELQRFCVARIMHPATKVIIADEMTTMLDPLNQAYIWEFVLSYARKHGITLLAVTHSKHLLTRIADRVIELDKLQNTAD